MMDEGDICICGHIHDVHFWGPCSTVNCRCEQFVLLDLAIDLFKALKQIASHPIGYGETFNGSAEMGARPVCHECQQKVEIAQAALHKAEV
jgi:hypothetical protein